MSDLSIFLRLIKESYLRKVSFISLNWRCKCIQTCLLAFSNGLKTLMICEEQSVMFVNPRPPKQLVLRCTSINNMKTSRCLYRPYDQINIDVATSEWCTATKTINLDRLLHYLNLMDPYHLKCWYRHNVQTRSSIYQRMSKLHVIDRCRESCYGNYVEPAYLSCRSPWCYPWTSSLYNFLCFGIGKLLMLTALSWKRISLAFHVSHQKTFWSWDTT